MTVSAENVEAVRELIDRLSATEFARLREAFETSSSLAEAAPKMGGPGRWHLDRLHPQVELDASALQRFASPRPLSGCHQARECHPARHHH